MIRQWTTVSYSTLQRQVRLHKIKSWNLRQIPPLSTEQLATSTAIWSNTVSNYLSPTTIETPVRAPPSFEVSLCNRKRADAECGGTVRHQQHIHGICAARPGLSASRRWRRCVHLDLRSVRVAPPSDYPGFCSNRHWEAGPVKRCVAIAHATRRRCQPTCRPSRCRWDNPAPQTRRIDCERRGQILRILHH